MANNSNKQKDKLVQNLDFQLEKINRALDSLRESVDALMNGDGKSPYWNGSTAFSILKTALTQYDTDKALLQCIYECKDSIKK